MKTAYVLAFPSDDIQLWRPNHKQGILLWDASSYLESIWTMQQEGQVEENTYGKIVY